MLSRLSRWNYDARLSPAVSLAQEAERAKFTLARPGRRQDMAIIAGSGRLHSFTNEEWNGTPALTSRLQRRKRAETDVDGPHASRSRGGSSLCLGLGAAGIGRVRPRLLVCADEPDGIR
jgi:hypothetical protein